MKGGWSSVIDWQSSDSFELTGNNSNDGQHRLEAADLKRMIVGGAAV